ncbi:CorA family divalent cation transporter [Sphingomonas bacterium]|uniref:CorA family divalent cation transporter n=1 Tax=Sphingomonas bacterium TaxID=1895847 RepID=UPI00157731AC|nr:CorA family divalent cation transporter [Sphingomonas bacterium]
MTAPPAPADGPVVFARVIASDGAARSIDWHAIKGFTPGEGELLWVHIDRGAPELKPWLRDALGLSESTIEALTGDARRPRAFREGNAVAAILRGIGTGGAADDGDLTAMQLWADATHVVTLRRHRLLAAGDVLDEVDASDDVTSAGDLVARLLEDTVARIGDVIVDMNDRIDALEAADDDADTPEGRITAIAGLRRRCLAMKRHLSPQQAALIRVGREAPAWFSDDNRAVMRETADLLHRFLEDIDVTMESAVVLQDDLNARTAAQTNRTSYLLSIVAAIFLPLGFVASLFSTNLAGTPGTRDGASFWILCGAMAALVAAQLVVFRRLRWL